jgi:hypothetical protein
VFAYLFLTFLFSRVVLDTMERRSNREKKSMDRMAPALN